MKIGRVFIKRTSFTPDDPLALIGAPDLFTPKDFDEIHISCVFTWDKIRAEVLREAWLPYSKKVIVGGPAFDDPGAEFIPGRYIKTGITITSRGCIFNCPWCFVPRREGQIRELKIPLGNEIQDNNLLACSKNHVQGVFKMLKEQRAIRFPGGLDARLLKDWHIEALRSLQIKELWFACDTKRALKTIKKIAPKLTPHFRQNQLRCYVLIGYGRDSLDDAEGRCQEIYDLGFLPFAQRYRWAAENFKDSLSGTHKKSEDENFWIQLARKWMRPAAMRAAKK